MSATAQFDRPGISAHAENTNLVAVFLTKQSHRTRSDRVVGRHQPRRDFSIVADVRVYLALDVGDLLGAQRARVREIEPEAIRRDKTALLRNMLAQPVAKRGVKQMRRRMIGADGVAALGIDGQTHGVADSDAAALDARMMGVKAP